MNEGTRYRTGGGRRRGIIYMVLYWMKVSEIELVEGGDEV